MTRTEKLRVQQKRRAKQATKAGSEPHVQAKAAEGVRGGGGALPHGDRIQAAFGHHDVSGIGAHVGGGAAAAADAIGAEAYATGDRVAFRRAPDLHTAAHEAAHVVQQRAGVQLKGGVGEVGDRYERHADQVADAVVRGESAQGLLDRSPAGSGSPGVQGLFGEEEEEEGPGATVSWIAEQIEDASTLVEHLGSLGDGVAREVIRVVASVNRQILFNFLLASPAHRLALYAAQQLSVEQLVSLAVQGQQALRGVIVGAARALGQLVAFVDQLYTQAPQVASACAHELETDLLPSVLQSCSELGYDLFYDWWPANTGLEATVSLTAGAEVPVWPAPPINVGGEGTLQSELKLYNKDGDGAPKLEFEIGSQTQQETSVGLEVPQVAGVSGNRTMSLASSIQTSTRFADIDWNTGLINALQSANHAGVLDALCEGTGNVVGATQFQVTLKASAGQGISAEAGLGDMANATVEQCMSLGLQLQVQTPTQTQDGKIEAQGTLTASMGASAELDIPGADNLGPMISYFAGNAGAGASAQAQIGGRLKWKIPKSDLTEMDPNFDCVELFVGGQVSGHVARESITVGSEGSIAFNQQELEDFEVPDIADGMTVTELQNALPFSQIGLKGSVEITSGLAGHALRRLVAGDSTAVQFLIAQPAVTGKVEVEFKFPKDGIAQLLGELGVVRPDNAGADWRESAEAPQAIDALLRGDIDGVFAAIRSAARDVNTFVWNSVDKLKVDLHGSTTHDTPEIPIDDLELSGSVRLRAGYSAEYKKDDIHQGMEAARTYLVRALPENLAGILRGG